VREGAARTPRFLWTGKLLLVIAVGFVRFGCSTTWVVHATCQWGGFTSYNQAASGVWRKSSPGRRRVKATAELTAIPLMRLLAAIRPAWRDECGASLPVALRPQILRFPAQELRHSWHSNASSTVESRDVLAHRE
jgi:hypothetical protein